MNRPEAPPWLPGLFLAAWTVADAQASAADSPTALPYRHTSEPRDLAILNVSNNTGNQRQLAAVGQRALTVFLDETRPWRCDDIFITEILTMALTACENWISVSTSNSLFRF